MTKEYKKVIPFARQFCHISPSDLEEILEWLKDEKYLSLKGKDFKTEFWELFIKE